MSNALLIRGPPRLALDPFPSDPSVHASMPQTHKFTILFDEPHEADWFRSLHTDLAGAHEEPITQAASRPEVKGVLLYDRPDIILLADNLPILVVEETVEVPSGHNVGQRFARLAAAAEAGIPVLYFGPYAARKHGGETAGPRFMNLRLFKALDAMIRVTGTAVTTINWPIDAECEVRRDKAKDDQVREYVHLFLENYYIDPAKLNRALLESKLQKQLTDEKNEFITKSIKAHARYDSPPDSVSLIALADFLQRVKLTANPFQENITKAVIYRVGMNYIRSDPYTGMGILYKYLYIVGFKDRALVLWFPNISKNEWLNAARNGRRKDIRLFKVAADGIIFKDGFVPKQAL